MTKSIIAQPGTAGSCADRNFCGDENDLVRYPAAFKSRVIDRSTAGSSSTRKVVKPASPITPPHTAKNTLGDWRWQSKYRRGAFGHVVLKRERAAVQLHNRGADRQAKAESTLFCCKKRLKHLLFFRRWQARTPVRNADVDPALAG